MAVAKNFHNLECSQAYHCLQIADQPSEEKLKFNFVLLTFVYRRLAQGLSRSLSEFTSFMREHLDPVIKADQYAQYVDDIGIAQKDTQHLVKSFKKYSNWFKNEMLPVVAEGHFGVQAVVFLVRAITPRGFAPHKLEVTAFSEKKWVPTIQKCTTTKHWRPELLQKLHTNLARTLTKKFQLV